MSDTVITVENLGKKYIIGHQRTQRYTALRDVIADNVKEAGRRVLRRPNAAPPTREDVWALKDVSFEVKRGERLGIIGRNGAGKSTLLKILSRITEPSAGEVRLRGRVASLLEVGTGFHPELTGRENIYLNGAILGMSRAEIARKFDEIVAFAEVEKFLDTPVKRYSSGMYVRLAFAVAAHLEPEILLVDEVLAVGDAAFQKKCLQKMGDVASEGRTILFVSHDMSAISVLCSRAILLGQGTVAQEGEPNSVITGYQQVVAVSRTESLEQRSDRRGEGGIRFTDVKFLDDREVDLVTATSGMPLTIRLYYQAEHDFTGLDFAISFRTVTGMPLILSKAINDSGPYNIIRGRGWVDCIIPDLPLADGSYYINISIQQASVQYDWIERAAMLDIVSLDYFQNGSIVQKGHSPILLRSSWRLNATVS